MHLSIHYALFQLHASEKRDRQPSRREGTQVKVTKYGVALLAAGRAARRLRLRQLRLGGMKPSLPGPGLTGASAVARKQTQVKSARQGAAVSASQ